MTKTNVERTLETLVEFAALQKNQLRDITQRFDSAMERVTASIDALAIQVAGLGSGINELKGLTRAVIQAIDKDRDVAMQQAQKVEKQSENIAQLIQLAQQQQRAIEQLVATNQKAQQ